MKITNLPTWSQVRAWLRELVAVIGVILSVTNAISWPNSIRGTVLLVSGILLSVEHGAQKILDPNTSINVTPTSSDVSTPAATSPTFATPPSN